MAIKETTLINDSYLKEYTPIPKNYNLDDIKPYVKVSELIWVKPVLGNALYQELLEQIEDEDISELNSTLLLKVYPLLGFGVIYEALPFIWSNISEVGITLGHSDNSESITLKDLDYILNHLKNQLQVRTEDLKDFLCKNKDLFPMYNCSCGCDCGCESKSKTSTFQQVYTPKKRKNDMK